MSVGFLLVTCCLEQTRHDILRDVIENIAAEAPELFETATVIDNASTTQETICLLTNRFRHVYQTNKNVGYWSAVHWWLESLAATPPKYTYIIESDMVHYAFNKLWLATSHLDSIPTAGSVRLHEYSVKDYRLYNKDHPCKGSRIGIWQSHTNKVTGEKIRFEETKTPGVWETNFLTQLPALNRYDTLRNVMNELALAGNFTELDFQRLYWKSYQKTGIVDGGIFHCDPGSFGAKTITGSWSSPDELKKLGYQNTRYATMVPIEQYKVVRL